MIKDRRQSACTGSAFRIYMGGNAIVTWYRSIADPESSLYDFAKTYNGAALIWIMGMIGVAALIDAIVNDFMPARFKWKGAVQQRHFIMAGMAFCYAAQLYIALQENRPAGLLIFYIWNASIIMYVTFIDARQRARDAQWQRSFN